MKENSIEEDIKILEEFKTNGYHILLMKYGDRIKTNFKLEKAIEHILSDYKRVLKENEKLKKSNQCYINSIQAITPVLTQDYIPIQKIKDIIDRIDYDIKKTKEIISKNTNIYASYRKNDYQIVRLRAMNTKSLDIKNRLQKLLESEE